MKYHSVRQIWHDSLHTGVGGSWVETGGKSDNCAKIYNQVLKGKAQAIIAKLPVLNRSWGNYCYSEYSDLEQLTVADHLLRIADPELGITGTFRRTARILILIPQAMADYRHRMVSKQPFFKISDYCRKIEVSQSNWKKNGWARRLYDIHQELDEIDREALKPLTELIDDNTQIPREKSAA